MKTVVNRIWNEEQGVLTFEWILLITLLVIGIVGAYSAVRDGVIDELGDVAEAVVNIDQSWTVEQSTCDPLNMDLGGYVDPGTPVTRQRSTGPISQ